MLVSYSETPEHSAVVSEDSCCFMSRSFWPPSIRRSVSRPVLQSLVSSFVISRLDYGNSTLAGVSSHLFPSVLWYCWLGLLTSKNRLPYNLYCVGGDVKHCSLTHFITSLVAAAVSNERRRPAHLFLVEVPAHHSAPSSAALAEGSRADRIQTISPPVQVSIRVRSPHLHTLLTSFVRWQMSRLVSDSVPVHPHHWLSAALDFLPSVTELFRLPLHVSGTVC